MVPSGALRTAPRLRRWIEHARRVVCGCFNTYYFIWGLTGIWLSQVQHIVIVLYTYVCMYVGMHGWMHVPMYLCMYMALYIYMYICTCRHEALILKLPGAGGIDIFVK